MVLFLTLSIMVIITWSIVSIFVLMEEDDDLLDISLKEDRLLLTASKIYWLGIFIIIAFTVLVTISSAISYSILCDEHSEDKICTTWREIIKEEQ